MGDDRRLTGRLDRRFAERAVGRRDFGKLEHRSPPPEDIVRALREKVDHIVILMMENHSYDSYFGTLTDNNGTRRGSGFTLGATGPTNSNPRSRAGDQNADSIVVKPAPGPGQYEGVPSQSWRASHIQWADGEMDGFVKANDELDPSQAEVPMTYWTSDQVPFYHWLATTFPVADHWHCSCLGPTFPNRRFLISGTAHGLMDDVLTGMFDEPENGTIFSLLTANKVSWSNYHHVPRPRLILTRLAGKHGVNAVRRLLSGLARLIPGLWSSTLGRLRFTANLYPAGFLRCVHHLPEIEEFFKDAKNGTLPNVSIVDPDFGSFSEENPQDIQLGESFAADVVDAVLRGAAWSRTILVWTYDEHGGYYDHVDPPEASPPDDVLGRSLLDVRGPFRWLIWHSPWSKKLRSADDWPIRTFERLGARVPTVIVSPFAKKDFVATRTYDHTSILRLIEDRWSLPPLTRRDAEAESPWEAFDFSDDGPLAMVRQIQGPAHPGAWRGTKARRRRTLGGTR